MVPLNCGAVAQFIFDAPAGTVTSLGGIDPERLRVLIDESNQPDSDRRVLFVPLQRGEMALQHVEHIIEALADTALRHWPLWFSDTNFAMCGNDTLGRQAAYAIAREAAERIPGLSCHWAGEAARLALRGKPPRVIGTLPAIELAQLSKAICREGLVFVTAIVGETDVLDAAQLQHALEWIAAHAHMSVVALFTNFPSRDAPFDRIMYGARQVIDEEGTDPPATESPQTTTLDRVWMLPFRGAPHPMSEIEKRMARMLADDPTLAGLFHFNWTLTTVRQQRPRVDLVWLEGNLVVEFDGYSDHSTRRAFTHDRQRDYELTLSGYTVLRLSNDEIAQDYGRALGKIRDLVHLRQQAMTNERRKQ